MNRRGLVGMAVLWILAALSALAMTAMAAGRLEASRGRAQLDETRAICLLQAGFLIARDAGFSSSVVEQTFESGSVRVERIAESDVDLVRVRGEATVGDFKKTAETGWRRSANTWRAVYWKEL